MTLYLLNTDMSSYVIRQRPHSVLQALEARTADGDELMVSAVTYAELLYGAERKRSERHRHLVEEFVTRLHGILPWDDGAAREFAVLAASLEAEGQPIGGNDTMIAGHALSAGAVLVANNERHFRRVPGLAVENWARL